MYFDMDCPCQGKNLDKLLQPVILSILQEGGDLHGFAIIKEMSKIPRFAENRPDAAGVYRYLKKMETSGLLTSAWDMEEDQGNPKRVYSITTQGKGCLANWSIALKDYGEYIFQLVEKINNGM
ncbi:MAG: PadR family transcriptional regulator [Anaerovoracaceae bacterium]